MNSGFIEHTHARFHYLKFGKGPKLVIAFHGYGREGSTFHFLEKYISNDYTLIAIDLPFHGYTTWDKKNLFHPSFLVQVIQELREKYGFTDKKFTMLGFSMGGRIALHLLDIMHKHVERIVLVAPDGLRLNPAHTFATRTYLGHKILHYTIHHPRWLLSLVNRAEKTGIINKSIASFVHYYIDDEPQRLDLYYRWTTMRKFAPNLSRIKKRIRVDKIKARLLFGKFDKIILSVHGERFMQGIEEFGSMQVVDATHHLLHDYNGARIAKLLSD
jgi:pimeloyl-ACP methyl ester carboxylesterase